MLTLGGVPEHFNYPIHKTLNENANFSKTIKWVNIPEGTGEMVRKLNEGEVDCALLLTEGATKAINQGSQFKIAQVYVSSPLVWGVHQLPNTTKTPQPCKENPILISRFGSGSHLMSYVWLAQHNIKPSDEMFHVIGTLDKALDHFKAQKPGYFLWEKYTTMPFVENGTLARTEEIPTPWPCFVLCLRNGLSEEQKDILLNKFWPSLKTTCLDLKNNTTGSVEAIASAYTLKTEKVKEWFAHTNWFGECAIEKEIKKAETFLLQANQLEKSLPTNNYLF